MTDNALSQAIAQEVLGQDRTTVQFELKQKGLPSLSVTIHSGTSLGALTAYQKALKEWDIIKEDSPPPQPTAAKAAKSATETAGEAEAAGEKVTPISKGTTRGQKQALMTQLNENALLMCNWARLILDDCKKVGPYAVSSVFTDKPIAAMNEKELFAFIDQVRATLQGQKHRPEVEAFICLADICTQAKNVAELDQKKDSMSDAQWAALATDPELFDEAKRFCTEKKTVLEAASAVAV